MPDGEGLITILSWHLNIFYLWVQFNSIFNNYTFFAKCVWAVNNLFINHMTSIFVWSNCQTTVQLWRHDTSPIAWFAKLLWRSTFFRFGHAHLHVLKGNHGNLTKVTMPGHCHLKPVIVTSPYQVTWPNLSHLIGWGLLNHQHRDRIRYHDQITY